jgi:hypothetical protein
MKKILLMFTAILLTHICAIAQEIGFILIPGNTINVAPSEKVQLLIQRHTSQGNMQLVISTDILSWNVNGQKAGEVDPSLGSLDPDLTLAGATYTAPSAAPANNPVAVSVTLHDPNDATGKAVVTMVCNITILKADYRITVDFETTGPEGMHYKYKGECYTNLKRLADGTLMLEPVDKSRQMKIDIDDAAISSYSTFTGPKEYYVPFLFTIDKINTKNPAPVKARIGFNTICPKQGAVQWVMHGGGQDVNYTCNIDNGTITYSPGQTQKVAPGGSPLAMQGMTFLDIFQYLGQQQVASALSTNMANSQQIMAMAQQAQMYRNNPAMANTPQGKAALQQMQAFQAQMGKPTTAAQTSTQMLPGTARVWIEGTYNPKGSSPFSGSLDGSVGPIQSSIKVQVEKLN